MKRLFSLILVLCILLASVAVAEAWTCSQCGAQNEHNFCGDCGAKKSNDWTCSGCGKKNTTKFCPDCGMRREDNQAKPAGKVITGTAEGFSSDVVVTLTVDDNNKILAVTVDASGELEAFGGRCATDAAFLGQFVGKALPLTGIDVLSGATVTSKAVMEAMNAAVGAKPTETAEAAQMVVRPRIEFQAGEGKCRVYLAYDNVVYAKDYHEDTNYHIGCLVENHGANEITVTPSAEINGETYAFNPRTIAAGDDHGFMVSSVDLKPGTYTVKWFMDGQLTNDYTVTVKDEYSATYEWVKSKIDVSLGLSIWDDAGERRVKDGISIGELSELADGQRYIPHMAVTNNDIKDTPPLFVAFYLDDDSWWWEEQVLSPGKKMNYVHTSYQHKEGASELIFYINGIRVDRTMFAILGD